MGLRSDTIRNVSYPSKPRAGGRPRDPARELAILRVALEVLAEVGFDRLSFEEVARRAGASKATLYRRWAGKREMVVAAVKAGPASGERLVVDTGSLRGDLLVLCRRLLATLRSAEGGVAAMLLQAALEDPELCDHLEESVGPTGARLPPAVLEAAIGRGELPAGAEPFAFEEVVGAVLILRTSNRLAVDDTYLEQLIDGVVIPALRTPAPGLHRGIFSGRPTPGNDEGSS